MWPLRLLDGWGDQEGEGRLLPLQGLHWKVSGAVHLRGLLSWQFAGLLDRLTFDDEVLGWVTSALRESHVEEKALREESIARLQAESDTLQRRVDTMYLDKLDGVIDAAFFERKSQELREEQARLQRAVQAHQQADQSYLEEGAHLLELAQQAGSLFRKQAPREQRRLLKFLLSN